MPHVQQLQTSLQIISATRFPVQEQQNMEVQQASKAMVRNKMATITQGITIPKETHAQVI